MQQAVNNPPAAPVYTRGPAWGSTATTVQPRSKLLPAGPSCQPCPDCGGLECLCRPRFFAGQLLTEQDLNRLDQYIVAKNQLHNRYLVGSGVVCGLEVQCSPCANTVSVSAGYAIDTCGNDIIVCSPDTVDICKLIAACTPTTAVNCAPYKDNTQCKVLEQDWILAIRYQESPSRGATVLTGSAQCGCGSAGSCSCGSSAVSKACGCGSLMPAASCCGQTVSKATQVSTNLPRRGAPPACEPTLTCEAYRYEVFLAPTPPAPVRGGLTGNLASLVGGEMFERIACCLQGVFAAIPPVPQPAGKSLQQWQTAVSTFCCNLRLSLMDYVQAHGGTHCQALAQLRAVACPTPGQPNFNADGQLALVEMALVVIELVLDCICSAALPPCPAPGDPRVPLASVRVRTSDCAILSICDWTPLRKNVVTTKTLGYWLGWLPFVPLLRAFMQELCCRTLQLPDQLRSQRGRAGVAPQASAPQASAPQANAPQTANQTVGAAEAQETDLFAGLDGPISFSARDYQASNPISEAIVANLAGGQNAITAGTLIKSLFLPVDSGASAKQLTTTPQAQVLAEIARPLISAFGPIFSAAGGNLNRQTSDSAPDAAAMRTELDALKATVAAQQSALDALRQPPPARQGPA